MRYDWAMKVSIQILTVSKFRKNLHRSSTVVAWYFTVRQVQDVRPPETSTYKSNRATSTFSVVMALCTHVLLKTPQAVESIRALGVLSRDGG